MKFLHMPSLLGLVAVAAFGAASQPVQADTFVSFDFPGTVAVTRGVAINDSGNVAGVIVDANGATRGYERFANGTFSAPIISPRDNLNYTRALGINNSGTIVGDGFNQDANGVQGYHGYLLNGSTFTNYDVGSNVSTTILAINNAGDFAGGFGSNSQNNQGFLVVGGVLTTFPGPTGNIDIRATGINDSDAIVGNYTDSNGTVHGYSREPRFGGITTIDIPTGLLTTAQGINDAGTIVGYYQDVYDNNHGFIDKAGVITTFNAPGSVSTTIRGINNAGVMVGSYTDSNGNGHGFLDIPSPNPTHILWTNTNGTAALWNYTASNDTFTSFNFGPYPGWSAKAIADGTDGFTRLLWNNTNGTAALWNVTSSTGAFTTNNFGPYTGWTAKAVSVSSTNTTHLLWTNTSGKAALWNVVGGVYQTEHDFGPYAGWTAQAIADGTDGKTRLLWTNTNGQAAFWNVSPTTGAFTQFSFGPYSGWSAKAVAVSPTTTHILWTNTNGTAAVWNYNPASGAISTQNYGPFSGWSATALADGSDDKTRLLWNNVNGTASFWSVDNVTGLYSQFSFGPYTGWTATAISTGP